MTIKVIGAGMGRTGTLSLKAALEQLGFDKCYHMEERFKHWEQHTPLWNAAGRGNPDWDTLFKGYKATVDFPGCTFYRELADYYPEAKVVLSVRDADKWYASTQETIFRPDLRASVREQAPADQEFAETCVYGPFDGEVNEREHTIARFKQHNEQVKANIPAARLLVFQVQDGWEPLCEFLGVPVPDTPFPRINEGESTAKVIDKLAAGEKVRSLNPNE